MVFLLVILMIAFFIIFEIIRSRAKVATASNIPLQAVPEIPQIIERYFHPGHSWALIEGKPTVTVGIDDFAQRFIGHLDGVKLPGQGSMVRQGDAMISLHHGEKTLTLVAPVSGVVEEINETLLNNPGLINHAPLDRGWIARIRPLKLSLELRNLLRGAVADRWREAVRIQFIHHFSPRLGTVLQDGGEYIENISDHLSHDDWQKLANEFFPSNVPTKHLNLKSLM